MNIFLLDWDPVKAAQLQCDKHVCKMIVESAQMLSTAHRLLDGQSYYGTTKNGRKILRHDIGERNHLFYKAVHTKHPSTVWTTESDKNYDWHYKHFVALCKEYTYRYGRIHSTEEKMSEILAKPPKNIPKTDSMTKFKLAMSEFPECIKECPVESYQRFYVTKQERFKMVWTKREIPLWFKKYSEELLTE